MWWGLTLPISFVAFGRKKGGLDFKAIDEKPVHFLFLIVAPPLEVSNQYLPVLGKIAQFSKEPDVPGRLLEISEPKQFLALTEVKIYPLFAARPGLVNAAPLAVLHKSAIRLYHKP